MANLLDYAGKLKKKLLDATTIDESVGKWANTTKANLGAMGSNVAQYFKPQTGTLATQGRQFLSQPIPQPLQPVNRFITHLSQNPVMQFGSGLIQGQNLGLGKAPIAPPQTTGGQLAYGVGALAGSMNPKSLTQRVIRPIVGVTNPIISKAISPVANKAISGRLASGIGNVAQGAVINPVYGRKPLEGAALDFATGVAFGPNQFKNLNIPTGKGFTLNRSTYDELIQAEDMIKRPDRFIGKINTGARTEIEAKKAIQKMGAEIVDRLSAKYLPNQQLNKTKNVEQQIKALTDLHYKNGLANMQMGLVGKKVDPIIDEARKYKSAEEFANSYSLYHGTPYEIEGGKLKFGGGKQLKKGGYMGGHFLTNEPDIANTFAFGGKVYQASGDIKNKVLDVNKNKFEFAKFIGQKYKVDDEWVTFTKNDFDFMFPKNEKGIGTADWSTVNVDAAEAIGKKMGKIGVAIPEYAAGKEGITYQLWQDNIPVYTRQQLIDIWNQAHQSSSNLSDLQSSGLISGFAGPARKSSAQSTLHDITSKYGWTANQLDDGTIQLSNRLGKPAATIKVKGDSYLVFDNGGQRIMSGKGKLEQSAEKVMRDYFYAKPNELKPIATKRTTQDIQRNVNATKQNIKAQNKSVPTEVYHSTPALEIEGGQLRASKSGAMGEGVYLHTNPDTARYAAAMQADGNLADQNVLNIKLKTNNIYKWTENGYPDERQLSVIKKYGHDGVIMPDGEIVVFDPKNIEIINKSNVAQAPVYDVKPYEATVYKGLPKTDWRTGKEITQIDATKAGKPMAGYFSSDEKVAQRFADTLVKKGEGKVVSAKVRMERPYIIDAQGKPAKEFMTDALNPKDNNQQLVNIIKNSDYDGIVIKNTADEGDIVIPRNSEQINVQAPESDMTSIGSVLKQRQQPQTPGLKVSQPRTAKIKLQATETAAVKEAEAIVERSLSDSGVRQPGSLSGGSSNLSVPESKYAFNINKNRLDLNPQEKQNLETVVKQVTPELEKAKGKPLTNKEVIEAAKKSDILTKVTTREETEAANAAMLRARQRMVDIDKQITADEIKGDAQAVAAKMRELVDSLRVVSAEAADRGRKLQSLSIQAGDESVRTQILKEVSKVETDTEKIVKEAATVNWDNAGEVAKFYRKFIKPTVTEILDEYRYNNMLANPRTQLRNAFSNLIQTYVTRPVTIAATGDLKGAGKYYQGAIAGLPKAVKEFSDTFSGKRAMAKPDMEHISSLKLPGFMTIPSRALEAGDRFFTTLIREGELARGTAIDKADDIAAYSLFRQDLNPKGQGKLLGAIDGLTEGVYSFGNRFPAFRWFVPFVRTPMNFAKQWIEYSPAGVLTLAGAGNKKEQLAKTMLGSGVALMGAQLAFDNRTTWAAPTDPKEKELFYASGKKPFSVKVGNKWVSMMYAGPFAFALALPAAYQYYQNESRTALTDSQLEKMGKTVSSMAEFLSGQTFLDGLDNFVSLLKGDADYTVGKNMAYTAGQMIPLQGLVRYISTIVDPVYRKAKTPIDQVKSGIPFVSQSLQPYTNPTGQESRRENQNFVTPYDITSDQPEWNQPLKERQQKLQSNAVVNEYKKQAENGTLKVSSATAKIADVDDEVVKARIKYGDLPKNYKAGDKYYITGTNGTIDVIDLSTDIPLPKSSSDKELNKKLLSSYKSKLTSRQTDISKLYDAGLITEEEAIKLWDKVETIKTKASGGKKAKKLRVGKSPSTKLTLSKGRKTPRITLSTPKSSVTPPKLSLLPSSGNSLAQAGAVRLKKITTPGLKIRT